MDIGSAKIMPEEMDGVPASILIECTGSGSEEFHVVRFVADGKAGVGRDYGNTGRVPIVVGGTGFYIQALLYDIDFTESRSVTVHTAEQLEELAQKTRGQKSYLHEMLKEVDPAFCREDPCRITVKRVIRALEYLHMSPASRSPEHNEQETPEDIPLRFCLFCLE